VPLVPLRRVNFGFDWSAFGWIAAADDRTTNIVLTVPGVVSRIDTSVGQVAAKDAPLFTIRTKVAAANPTDAQSPTGAGGDQPAGPIVAIAQRRQAADIALESDRRDFPIPGRRTEGYSVTDLRTIEDWQLERRFMAVPGVVDVNGWGGKSKTYDVTVDLKRLNDAGLTLAEVVQVLNNNNVNVGDQTIHVGRHAAVVRGVALIQSMDGIRNTILSASAANSVLVRDVAEVEESLAPRLGNTGPGRRRRYRAGHRADAPRRADQADHLPRQGGDGQNRRLRNSAERCSSRTRL
jgi:hypothetical protein